MNKIDLSFIDSIFQGHIDVIKEERKYFLEITHYYSYLTGSIEALERTREEIKNWIKEANKLTEKQ